MKLTIYTDGASRGNPGPASYGFAVYDQDLNIEHEQGKYLGTNTNNFAEYSAVLAALEYVVQNYEGNEYPEINFFMDSKLVVEQLSGRYKIKSPTLLLLINDIRKLEKFFPHILYTHVPREKNKVADRLANLALDKEFS
jgi:ribonuclease HI